MLRREVEKIIGEEYMTAFDWFMRGKTVGSLKNTNYYISDVENFAANKEYFKRCMERENTS